MSVGSVQEIKLKLHMSASFRHIISCFCLKCRLNFCHSGFSLENVVSDRKPWITKTTCYIYRFFFISCFCLTYAPHAWFLALRVCVYLCLCVSLSFFMSYGQFVLFSETPKSLECPIYFGSMQRQFQTFWVPTLQCILAMWSKFRTRVVRAVLNLRFCQESK